MSIVSSLNHSKFFSFSQPKLHLGNGSNSISHVNSIRFSSRSVIPLPKFSTNLKSITRLRAYDSDDYSEIPPEDEEIISKAITTLLTEEIKEEEEEEEVKEITNLKKSLIDLLYGTERGLKASSDTRAEIIELISELESNNPIPAPNDGLTTLGGKWILAYTSFTGLFPLLAKGTTPLVSVGEISQIIDTENFTVQNSVQFVGPLATTTSLSTNAKYEVRSPKRVQIKFEEGIIGTPQLTDFIIMPESVEFLGHKIDLTPFNGLFTSVHDTASYVIKTISSQPPLKIPITKANAESWLLTTYLDKELRISREDGGSIFVFIKEGSSLLKP